MILIATALLALALGPEAEVADRLRTVAERTAYRATARFDDVVTLGDELARSSSLLRVDELGRTVEGRRIPLWWVADPPVDAQSMRKRTKPESGKLLVLLVGNIHGGEVCGKEALPMLARELIARPGHPLLKDLIIALVPIYNADGNERVARDNRPGQDGPVEGMGQRPNASSSPITSV
jgi:dipeptidyl-peptidase-4